MDKRLLIIGGSVRQEESRSNLLIDAIEKLVAGTGALSVVWKLGYKPLPLAQHDWHKNPSMSQNKNVEDFALEIAQADVVFLVSPIYNGSYSGALKNALDCMRGDALTGKQVVLVGVGSGASAMLPCVHLQDVARTMGGQVYHRFIVTMGADIDFQAKAISEGITTRIVEVIEKVTI